MKLTEREFEILKMLCLPQNEIAERLCISPVTVRCHINNIYSKFFLPLNNSTMLLIEALKQKIVSIDDLITC